MRHSIIAAQLDPYIDFRKQSHKKTSDVINSVRIFVCSLSAYLCDFWV